MPKAPDHIALVLDASSGQQQLRRYRATEVLGPIDLSLRMQAEGDFLCIGSGILSGSIIPGSNRLVFSGVSPVWDGFYVSTMGGAGLIWDGVGVHSLAIGSKAYQPSVLVLSGTRGQQPKTKLIEVDLESIWRTDSTSGGFYALQDFVFNNLWDGQGTPRVLAVGPASQASSMGAIGSSRTRRGKISQIDCWAGRGGFGSKLLQEHNICAIVYGGDFEDEDLTDRAEADGYFQKQFSKKMKLVDLEATTKYRYDPKFQSGGTFGVNYSKLTDLMLSFNSLSVFWSREKRHVLWERLVRDHYLRQFNQETIETRQQSHCGEPCPAVCKKYHQEYKKDYEPYQTMGPLSGIFDQRAAEKVNHHADALGFDAIQVGGQVAWIMECLHAGVITSQDLGLAPELGNPIFDPEGFDPVADSMHNAEIAYRLLDMSANPDHILSQGMRQASKELGKQTRARAVYLANGVKGWMVPNQYWVPGMFAPQSIMGKYYVYYHFDYHPPFELGQLCAKRMLAEVTTDNAGMCRFHRGWSEKAWPDIVCGHHNTVFDFHAHHLALVRQIHKQGKPIYWQTDRVEQMIHTYLIAVREDAADDADLGHWLYRFEQDRSTAAKDYWQKMSAGIASQL